MSQAAADHFDSLSDALVRAAVRHSPAELHGVICGLLSTGHGSQDAELLGMLAAHVELAAGWEADTGRQLLALRDLTRDGFTAEGLELQLVLPEEDSGLSERITALGQWCEGFLVGFGTGSAGVRDSDLAPGLQEALSDIAAISQIGAPDEDDEEDAQMFEQVAEHCRLAALMVFTELALAARQQEAAPAPAVPPVTH